MKIAQINTVLNSGSTGRIAEQIGSTAQARGHESLIAHGRKTPRPSASVVFPIGGRRDALLHGARSLLSDGQGLGSRRATRQLVAWLSSQRPDAVGLHNLHGYYVNYPVLFDYLVSAAVPVVWTFHDCWPFTGHCAYFDRAACDRWKVECHDCPLTERYPRSVVDRSRANHRRKKRVFGSLGRQLVIVTPSRWLARQVEASFLGGAPVHVVHNGVDLETFVPGARAEQRPIALGVANQWDDRKGLDDLVALRKRLPASWRVVAIGVSPQQRRSLPAGVEGIERTENVEELVGWYQRAQVLVNPTHGDNFPTTNVEALASGTPVVTYDVGGSPEAVDEATGTVVKEGDVEGLAQGALAWATKDRATNREVCRRRAEVHFNKDDRFAEYVDLYETLNAGEAHHG